MSLNYLLLYSVIVATISIIAGVLLSNQRPWSFPRGSLFWLALTGTASAAIELYIEFYPALTGNYLTLRSLKLYTSVSAGGAVAFFIASISLFVVVSIEALYRFQKRERESTDV